jgi:hypothetical protein
MTDSNPLKQYFRRPSVFLKLPSAGHGYPEGTIDLPENGEIPIYPMTAIDEITTKTPDALFNGTALVDLIKSCAPNIKDPYEMPNIDLNPILVAIRSASHGSVMEITSVCPECKEDTKFDVNLTSVLASFSPGNYAEPLILEDDITIKFKSIAYKDVNTASIAQFTLQKQLSMAVQQEDQEKQQEKMVEALKELNEVAYKIIANSIEYIKIPGATVLEKEYIIEFLKSCSARSFDKIKDFSKELRESTDTKPLHVKCYHCQHEYDQIFNVNPVDFFG